MARAVRTRNLRHASDDPVVYISIHLLSLRWFGERIATLRQREAATGVTMGWAMVAFLPFPYIVRMALDGWTVYPVWAAVGTLLVGLVVALVQPQPRA